MKYDPQGVATPRPDATDPMAKIDPVGTSFPLHWAIMNGEGHRVALFQSNHFRSRLHAWPLLGEHKFSSSEVPPRLRQQNCDLDREDMLAIEILMETIEIARSVLQEQRCRPTLSGAMAALKKIGVRFRVLDINTHQLIPSVRDRLKMRIQCRPQVRDDLGQRIFEVLVLAFAEAVALHDDAAAKRFILRIQRCHSVALRLRDEPRQYGIAVLVEISNNALPIKSIHAIGRAVCVNMFSKGQRQNYLSCFRCCFRHFLIASACSG